jgi:hypothetical protein
MASPFHIFCLLLIRDVLKSIRVIRSIFLFSWSDIPELVVWFLVVKLKSSRWKFYGGYHDLDNCTGFVTRVIRRMPLVEQELLTLPEYLYFFAIIYFFCHSSNYAFDNTPVYLQSFHKNFLKYLVYKTVHVFLIYLYNMYKIYLFHIGF